MAIYQEVAQTLEQRFSINRHTLRSMDGRPVNLISHYLRQQTLIGTKLPSQSEAELLQYPRHMPVLVVKSNNVHAGTKQVLEYSIARGRADCFEFRVQPFNTDQDKGESTP